MRQGRNPSLMYYTRTVWITGIRQALLHVAVFGIVLVIAPVARSQTPDLPPLTVDVMVAAGVPSPAATELARAASQAEALVVEYAPAGRPAVPVRVLTGAGTSGQRERLAATAQAVLLLLDDWFGPYPHASLTVVDVPWNSSLAGASFPGVVAVSTRLIAPRLDVSLERSLIGAIARQYWQGVGSAEPSQGWLQEGFSLYSGIRAIHQYLDGRHYASVRAFDGLFPYVIRSVQLSPREADPRPRLMRFDGLDAPEGAAQRMAVMLATLERYLGWPELQAAMSAFRARFQGSGATLDDFSTVMSEQRGQDMSWFFNEARRFDADFDYGIAGVTSEPAANSGRFQTTVTLARFGEGIITGAGVPSGDLGVARSIPFEVAFEDGTLVREWLDGRPEQSTHVFESASPAQSVSIDPAGWLLLDSDRRNNFRHLTGDSPAAPARPVVQWTLWLQSLLLTWTTLL